MSLEVNSQSNSGKSAVFKTFPEFSKLTFADRGGYDAYVTSFPPIGDIQFSSLMTWWDSLDNVSVAELNGNLVVQYWRPGDEGRSGLSLIGTHKVDESICIIFDYLRERNEPVHLVNVPEFVVSATQYPDLFNFSEERWYHDYVVPVRQFYPLRNIAGLRKRKVERLLHKFDEENLVSKNLDLHDSSNLTLLLEAAEKWWKKNLNNFGKVGFEAMKKCILHADLLGIENVCFFADGELLGFCLYRIPQDKRYAILMHVKATHKDTLSFDFIAYLLAKWLADQGIMYANLTEDWGRLRLRMFLLTLGPSNFFRKYQITSC